MLKLRLANSNDVKKVFDLSNDEVVRKNSINQNSIKWDEHKEWFNEKIISQDTIFYIAEEEDNFIGYCRLNKEDKVWIITIHINHNYRNKGIGCSIIKWVCAQNKDKEIIAYVKSSNIPSYKMFVKSNFEEFSKKIINGDSYTILKNIIKKNIIAVSNEMYEKTGLFKKPNTVFIKSRYELTFENLKKINPEYVFFPHWSYIIPQEIYENFNCVIFHMTDLPFGRGGSPLQNLIERGIYKTKISAIKCIKNLDAGDIYLKKDFDISQGSAQLIYQNAGKIISEMIDEIITQNPNPVPQKGQITEFKRRKAAQSNIECLGDLKKIYDYIRMLDADGYPRAFMENEKIKIEFSNAELKDNKIIARAEIKVKNE